MHFLNEAVSLHQEWRCWQAPGLRAEGPPLHNGGNGNYPSSARGRFSADVLPIICEMTWHASVADVIHCLTTEVISEGTWEWLIFFCLSTGWDYKRTAPRHTDYSWVKQRAAFCFTTWRLGMCSPDITAQQATEHQLRCSNRSPELPWSM